MRRTGDRVMLSMAVLAALLLTALPGLGAAKPKVPPGRDPGGVAIAVVGAGVDYRRAEIAARVARDGEGELIGWDFADDDRAPFSESEADNRAARLILEEAPAARLVPLRVTSGREDLVPAALRFVGGTPARIVALLAEGDAPLPVTGLSEAARYFPRLLLVVPVARVSGAVPGEASDGSRSGLLIVGAVGHGAGDATPVVDLLVDAEGGAGDVAAARVAALAARLLAREPGLDGAGLRARVLSMAKPRSGAPPLIPDAGRLVPSE